MHSITTYFEYTKLLIKSALETIQIKQDSRATADFTNIKGKSVSIFFIFSFGRSGTQFLSRCLNNDPNSAILHEPLIRDNLEYLRSFNTRYCYHSYIYNIRRKYIQNYVSDKECRVYGEVNSLLRRHSAAIMQDIPNVNGLYLIRDGRDVVRSMMTRYSLVGYRMYNKIKPQENDPYFHKWDKWGCFEKCCWIWAYENSMLYRQFGPAMKFELLLEDYGYVQANLFEKLKINISKSIWEKERFLKSANKTKQFTIKPYEKWPVAWKDSFWEICGEIMETHGYR